MGQQFDLSPALRAGIRPRVEIPRNAMVLKECTNLRSMEYGLKPFRTISQPITDTAITVTAGMVKEWPFPQIFRGKYASYMVGDGPSIAQAYLLAENEDSPWTIVSPGTVSNANQMGEVSPGTGPFTNGSTWHFADFYDTVMFFNGECVVFRAKGADYPSARWWVSANSDATVPTINTGCSFWEGRALLGGFNSSDFRTSAWQTFFNDRVKNTPAHIINEWDVTGGPGQNWIWWSSIGGDDLLGFWSADYLTYGALGSPSDTGYGPDNPWVEELWMRNEAGMRPMPFTGLVQHMVPYGAFVIVYGTNGICAIHNELNQVPEISLPTFGLAEMGLNTLGTASRSASGGTDQVQLFIDEGGELWIIQGEYPTPTKLGFQEIFSNMLGNEIVISHEPLENEFYISDGTETYVLGKTGLSRAPWHPTTVNFAQGGLVGVLFDDDLPNTVTVRTNTFDFGTREIKEIIDIHMGSEEDDDNEWTVTVYYRFDNSVDTAWSSLASIAVRDYGRTALRTVSGVDFEFEFSHPDKTVATLDSIGVEVRVGGKQSIRRLLT